MSWNVRARPSPLAMAAPRRHRRTRPTLPLTAGSGNASTQGSGRESHRTLRDQCVGPGQTSEEPRSARVELLGPPRTVPAGFPLRRFRADSRPTGRPHPARRPTIRRRPSQGGHHFENHHAPGGLSPTRSYKGHLVRRGTGCGRVDQLDPAPAERPDRTPQWKCSTDQQHHHAQEPEPGKPSEPFAERSTTEAVARIRSKSAPAARAVERTPVHGNRETWPGGTAAHADTRSVSGYAGIHEAYDAEDS